MVTRTLSAVVADEITGFLELFSPKGRRNVEIGEFVTIGREPSNHLTIDDDCVSSRHARVERKEKGFLLRDLRSRNGSFINGARVLEAMLTDGDRVRFGNTELLFSSTMELPSPQTLSSRSESWQAQLQRMPVIADSEMPVLITGPSGSGKEILAQEIHRRSRRAGGPLISVNCSALSESLVESELFGHTRGSFTGATADRKGAFEAARSGTLFLDEIGDLPLELQPKLLRALENQQIRPVGSDRTVETHVRIVAATHQRLRQKVSDGSFRADLYFRLNVIHIEAPALTDRMEDFETLLYHFGKIHRIGFSFAAIQRLKEHTWPGNIRELKNVVARAKAYFSNRQVEPDDLPMIVDFIQPSATLAAPATHRPVIREIEHEMIKTRLIANRGNQRKTAADLGMPKSTLHDRIQSYGIDVHKLLLEAGFPPSY